MAAIGERKREREKNKDTKTTKTLIVLFLCAQNDIILVVLSLTDI